ncbi:MAG: PD-(D/E)XK nuclease family protein [Candidatus Aenigmarchaeota archaeon]|nr:PD-(D/E)XK nuclease family protein [Candidatus Aenigmarchaeota archaeon]
MPIRGISPSLIDSYNTCPMSLYFDRIVDPKPDVPKWIGAVFGTAIHYFISTHIYKNSQYPLGFKDKKSMIGFWCHFWDDVVNGNWGRINNNFWYRNFEKPEDLKKKGIGILSLYWDNNLSKPKPDFVELEIEKSVDGFHLIGVIDQIRPGRYGHQIIDLKTGRTYGEGERNEFALYRNIQLTFYSMLYRLHFGKNEEAVGIYDLNTGKIMLSYRNQRDINSLLDRIKQIAEDMSDGKYPRIFGKHCSMCDFQEPCIQPEKYFDREQLDEEQERIIFSPFEKGIKIEERNVTVSNKVNQKKAKQLRFKFK